MLSLQRVPTLKLAPRRSKSNKPKKHKIVDSSVRAARRRGLTDIGTFDPTRLRAKAVTAEGHKERGPAPAAVADGRSLPVGHERPMGMDGHKNASARSGRLQLKPLLASMADFERVARPTLVANAIGQRSAAELSASGLTGTSGGGAQSARLERAVVTQLPSIRPRGADLHNARMRAAKDRFSRGVTVWSMSESDRANRRGLTESLPELPLRKVDAGDAPIRSCGPHTVR
jgi:hypothetical protein